MYNLLLFHLKCDYNMQVQEVSVEDLRDAFPIDNGLNQVHV